MKPPPFVSLIDVDNTLLDNDQVNADLSDYLVELFGPEHQRRYWRIFEEQRDLVGYSDYLGSLQRYRAENLHDPRFIHVSCYLTEYDFAKRVYPHAFEAIDHLSELGPTVILTDGDVVFQPRKVFRSGLFRAVDGRVLIYIHKEKELADIEAKYPAERYILIDDKPRILAAVKRQWGGRVTTILPHQGHYALAPDAAAYQPAPDLVIQRIGDLRGLNLRHHLDRPGPGPHDPSRQDLSRHHLSGDHP